MVAFIYNEKNPGTYRNGFNAFVQGVSLTGRNMFARTLINNRSHQLEGAIDLPSRVEAELMDLNELRAGPSAQTLQLICDMFAEVQLAPEGRARRSRHGQHPRLTDINVYHDPLERSWKAWYTNFLIHQIF